VSQWLDIGRGGLLADPASMRKLTAGNTERPQWLEAGLNGRPALRSQGSQPSSLGGSAVMIGADSLGFDFTEDGPIDGTITTFIVGTQRKTYMDSTGELFSMTSGRFANYGTLPGGFRIHRDAIQLQMRTEALSSGTGGQTTVHAPESAPGYSSVPSFVENAPFVYTSAIYCTSAVGNIGTRAYLNGAPSDAATVLQDISTGPAIEFQNTMYFYAFKRIDGAGGRWDGMISEIIIYRNMLTRSEQQLVEGFLAWEYGIPLFVNHPYSAGPPLLS
jgi:hypothetical protein